MAQGQLLSEFKNPDSVLHSKSRFFNRLVQKAMNSVRKDHPDDTREYVAQRSEALFLPYNDRVIRKIYIETYNFDRSVFDTSIHVNNLVTRVGKRLHITTRKFVIQDNLFIKEGSRLNAYKIADNERYLRSLEYLQDARIIVHPDEKHPDSVDVFVVTKDFFSIAGGAASNGFNHINGDLYETNLGGMAQRIEVTGLYDYNRSPMTGYGLLYRKSNVLRTFIDATACLSTMKVNPNTGEEETTNFLSLSKRLVSPYSRTAGGLLLSTNRVSNLYHIPEKNFFAYRYALIDAWAGYSIGISQLTATNNDIRDRRFLSFRYIDRSFLDVPVQVGKNFDPFYNSSKMGLAQLTMYRQDYYKTRYIYGFGTTEDVPYGYNVAIVAGLQKQLDLQRPYAGISAAKFMTTRKGGFLKLYLRTGSFFNKNTVQDASLLIGVSAFSRLLFTHHTRIRAFANLSYAQLFNRVTYEPLTINNSLGLRGFLSDSIYGTRRLSLQLETEFYIKGNFFGFRFAPFPYADLSVITPQNAPFGKSALHASLGGGIRARNPNLVFETIELRAYYFPTAPDGMRGFKVIVTSNVKFKFTSNYITAPDVVQLNRE